MRIATRASALARWQANHIGSLLLETEACDEFELVPVSTSGDRDVQSSLSEIGGKGVFVKEVQLAVLDGRADIAVHSAKDMPAAAVDDLAIAAVPPRGDPRDVLVGARFSDLGAGSRVATGSARRRAQLQRLQPGLDFHDLRGNIATRLEKASGFDAIVMAKTALDRLDLQPDVVDPMPVERMIPQVGQGFLAVECRASASDTVRRLGRIDDPAGRRVLEWERAFLRELGGDCSLPAGAHATATGAGEMRLAGFLASEDLDRSHSDAVTGLDQHRAVVELVRRLRDVVAA